MGDYLNEPFTALLELWKDMADAMDAVIDFLSIKVRLGNFANIVELIENLCGIDIPIPTEVTIFGLFVGGSITVFLVLTIVKWVIGIVQ